MSITWILVANASIARVYSHNGSQSKPTRIKEMKHPQSRMRNAELVTDRAGHMQGSGDGHGSRQPRTEAKAREAAHFARELAQEFNQARNSRQFEHIILVAPPAFMGLIGEQLDAQTAKLVTSRIEKDYTQSTDQDLAVHLGF